MKNLLATLEPLVEHVVEEHGLRWICSLDIQTLHQVLLDERSPDVEFLVSSTLLV